MARARSARSVSTSRSRTSTCSSSSKPAGFRFCPPAPSRRALCSSSCVRATSSRAAAAPAHRLGRGTSGLIAFGKTADARSSLARQFRELTLVKTYLAWVEGQPAAGLVRGAPADRARRTWAVADLRRGAAGQAVAHARARAAPRARPAATAGDGDAAAEVAERSSAGAADRAGARRRPADHGPTGPDSDPPRRSRRADRRRSAIRARRHAEERRAAGGGRISCTQPRCRLRIPRAAPASSFARGRSGSRLSPLDSRAGARARPCLLSRRSS